MIFFFKDRKEQASWYIQYIPTRVSGYMVTKEKKKRVSGYIKYLQMEEIENIYFMQEKWIIISL